MRQISYENFDVRIQCASGDHSAQVIYSPAGQTKSVPFSLEQAAAQELVEQVELFTRGAVVGRAEIAAHGERLFKALFAAELEMCLQRSLDRVGRGGLRIRLWVDCAELAAVPWEYLYFPAKESFPGLSDYTPIVRYSMLPEAVEPLPIEPPLGMLVMIASPDGLPRLEVEQEWKRLATALDGLQSQHKLAIERVERPTAQELQRHLRRGPFHVLHFIGHGAFDEQSGEGVLAIENDTGGTRLLRAQQLSALLGDHKSLRVVVLNSCEGSRSDRKNLFAGTAQRLVQQGIPAVIAMQFPISDHAAITFSQSFYESVADGFPLDASLAEARKAIHMMPNDVEWGTPVLYMRSEDGRIFTVGGETQRAPAAVPAPAPAETPAELVKRAKARWAIATTEAHAPARLEGLTEAYRLLDRAKAADPTNTEVLLLIAQLLIELTPDDPTDERRVLEAVRRLLQDPVDDVERLRLAHALYLLASTGEPPDPDGLEEAKRIFAAQGREDMVRRCESLASRAAPAPAGPAPQVAPPAPSPAAAGPGALPQPEAPASAAPFAGPAFPAGAPPVAPGGMQVPAVMDPAQLVGRWRFEDGDGSILTLDLYPNGVLQGVGELELMKVFGAGQMTIEGQWGFDPSQQILRLAGRANGFLPFDYAAMLHGRQGTTIYGVDAEGTSCVLTPG